MTLDRRTVMGEEKQVSSSDEIHGERQVIFPKGSRSRGGAEGAGRMRTLVVEH